MGNISCCFEENDTLLSNRNTLKPKEIHHPKKDFFTHSNSIIKLQSFWRGFSLRKKLKNDNNIDFDNFNTKHSNQIKVKKYSTKKMITPSDEFDENSKPGEIIKIEDITINEKIIETENKLGDFVIDEKELILYIQKNKNRLKNYCLKYNNGSVYLGYFNKYWQREGYGILIFEDGSKYQGFFNDNKMNGRGRLVGIEGDYYEGEFKDDKANEFGKYVNKKGGIYIGQWLDDKQHWRGDELFPDGSRYIGEYYLGNRNGKGKFIWLDGSFYEGDFINNIIDGIGIYKWRDGRIYYGQWKKNKMEGKGLFLWTDKKKYLGDYKNDKKSGLGIFIWPDGRKYRGNWKKGKQHGFGIFKNGENSHYGEWSEGKRIKWLNETSEEIIQVNKNFDDDFMKDFPKIILDILNKSNNKNNFKNSQEKKIYFDEIDYKLTNLEIHIHSLISKSQTEESNESKEIKLSPNNNFKTFVNEIGKDLISFQEKNSEDDEIKYFNTTDFGNGSRSRDKKKNEKSKKKKIGK